MGNDILKVQGVKEKGYGIIAKLAMQDKRLTIEAKAIYGYFCSFAGTGTTAFPGRDKIVADLMIRERRYYRHFKLLKELGYIKVEQQRNKKGEFKRNIYTLMEYLPCSDTVAKDSAEDNFADDTEGADDACTDEDMETSPVPPSIQNEHTDKTLDFIGNNLPCIQNSHTVNKKIREPCGRYRHTDSDYTNINSFKNNIYSSHSQSVYNKHGTERNDKTDTPCDIGEQINEKEIEDLIKENIDYSGFMVSYPQDIKLVDSIIAIMVDVFVTEERLIYVAGGNKPRSYVKKKLLSLGYDDIEHVISQFMSVPERINKKHQYILTMLYTCKSEINLHYKNHINYNGANRR